MEYRKNFEFSNFKFSEDFSFEILLNGSGSFVIAAPDWPPEAGIISPERDGKIAEEFIGCLEEAVYMISFDYDCDTYSRIPYNTGVLVDYINREKLPFRWEFEAGYRLKEISFASLYPADEDSTKTVVNAKKLKNLDKSISELQSSRDNSCITELNQLLSERNGIRKHFLDIKLRKVLEVKNELEEVIGKISSADMAEFQNKMEQAYTQIYGDDDGLDYDETKMREYLALTDKIEQAANPMIQRYKNLEKLHCYLAGEYNDKCDEWDIPSEYQD